MEVIRLLQHPWELSGTLYFEFQPGVHTGKHWLPDSVYVREEFWADLGGIVARHEPRYSHYSFVTISGETWASILVDFDRLASGLKAADREHTALLFPALFRWFVPPDGLAWRRTSLRYGILTRTLSAWVRRQLSKHGAVSVLVI